MEPATKRVREEGHLPRAAVGMEEENTVVLDAPMTQVKAPLNPMNRGAYDVLFAPVRLALDDQAERMLGPVPVPVVSMRDQVQEWPE